jgi:hypothetical protein
MPVSTLGTSSIGDANEVTMQSAKAGQDAVLSVGGPYSDTNANLIIRAKGSGIVKIQGKLALQTGSINVTGSKGGNAALTAVIAALVSIGLITDSTS